MFNTFSLNFLINSINGIPACVNKELLVDIVRNEWGFKGYISTDDGATINEITQQHLLQKHPRRW